MRQYRAVVMAVAFWCAIPGPPQILAQQVSSFEQLQLLVKPGDKIEVIGADGQKTKGKIESLTPASLRLKTKDSIRDYAQKDAFEVSQKRPDSLGNGAWIGALAGGGFVAALGIACLSSDCYTTGREFAAAAVVYTGFGAAIGVGIDAMLIHRQTIYKLPPQTALKSVRVAPLLSNGRRGAELRFSF